MVRGNMMQMQALLPVHLIVNLVTQDLIAQETIAKLLAMQAIRQPQVPLLAHFVLQDITLRVETLLVQFVLLVPAIQQEELVALLAQQENGLELAKDHVHLVHLVLQVQLLEQLALQLVFNAMLATMLHLDHLVAHNVVLDIIQQLMLEAVVVVILGQLTQILEALHQLIVLPV